ncbi:MAG: prepilin-type cleavage/methylation domain-containing protein, partial [Pseudomonadota bacterium]|nr:prepilin-type cleavage/methylation domain-containing protein [Pseudomonadota bacterium]
FVTLSTQGALDVGSRQQRALQGVVVSEQVSRELRHAFPISVRTSGSCIEWLPTLSATAYVRLTHGPDFDKIEVAPFASAPSLGDARALVYGYGSATTNDLYDTSNPGPVSPLISNIDNSVSPAVISLSAAHRFSQRSPERRVFVVGSPISYCQSGRFLYRYSDYGASPSQPTPPATATREVLAANLTGTVDFSFAPATLQRGALVSFTFTLEDPRSGETTTVSQEVQIRNVP